MCELPLCLPHPTCSSALQAAIDRLTLVNTDQRADFESHMAKAEQDADGMKVNHNACCTAVLLHCIVVLPHCCIAVLLYCCSRGLFIPSL